MTRFTTTLYAATAASSRIGIRNDSGLFSGVIHVNMDSDKPGVGSLANADSDQEIHVNEHGLAWIQCADGNRCEFLFITGSYLNPQPLREQDVAAFDEPVYG